jgi:single-strand DNA-binding protein
VLEVMCMSAHEVADPESGRGDDVNVVRLVGRLSATPAEVEMPSGDVLCTFRVVVGRPPGHRSAQLVDALECSTSAARVRRSASSWQPGDVVEVEGAIRRRFFRTAAGAASRVEVEVSSARRVRRAATA